MEATAAALTTMRELFADRHQLTRKMIAGYNVRCRAVGQVLETVREGTRLPE